MPCLASFEEFLGSFGIGALTQTDTRRSKRKKKQKQKDRRSAATIADAEIHTKNDEKKDEFDCCRLARMGIVSGRRSPVLSPSPER